jgi:hypothetical protein
LVSSVEVLYSVCIVVTIACSITSSVCANVGVVNITLVLGLHVHHVHGSDIRCAFVSWHVLLPRVHVVFGEVGF